MLDKELSNHGVIYAETFDSKVITFELVMIDNEYYLKMDKYPDIVKRLVLRPNFWAIFYEGNYIDCRSYTKIKNPSTKGSLVKEYYIDPVLFPKLVKSGALMYTTAMADLYDLPREYARDIEYHKNDYKNTHSKQKVLSRWKDGQFN